MLIGGVSTYWFTVESIDGVENAVLAFIPEEYLSPMPEGATVAMLRRLGRIAGLQLTTLQRSNCAHFGKYAVLG